MACPSVKDIPLRIAFVFSVSSRRVWRGAGSVEGSSSRHIRLGRPEVCGGGNSRSLSEEDGQVEGTSESRS